MLCFALSGNKQIQKTPGPRKFLPTSVNQRMASWVIEFQSQNGFLGKQQSYFRDADQIARKMDYFLVQGHKANQWQSQDPNFCLPPPPYPKFMYFHQPVFSFSHMASFNVSLVKRCLSFTLFFVKGQESTLCSKIQAWISTVSQKRSECFYRYNKEVTQTHVQRFLIYRCCSLIIMHEEIPRNEAVC